MQNWFEQIQRKLLRIQQQISELEKSIFDYWNLNNIDFILNEKKLWYKLIVRDIPQDIPLNHWDEKFWECIHNLRSVLDNFAFYLAKIEKNPPDKPRDIYFPIFLNKKDFDLKKKKILYQLPRSAQIMIERLQPFNRDGSRDIGPPEEDALYILHQLDILDKHHSPSVVLISPTEIWFNGSITFESEEAANRNSHE